MQHINKQSIADFLQSWPRPPLISSAHVFSKSMVAAVINKTVPQRDK
jgi:hypothetical protein